MSNLKKGYIYSSFIEKHPNVFKNSVVGRPLLNPSQEPDNNTVSIEFEPKPLRSQSIIYDKNSCIICQQSVGPLHKVAFTQTGESMLNDAQKMNDPGFLIRLNAVSNAADAVANDVQYHLKCWVNAQRSVANDSSDPIQEMNDIDSVLADIEIINVVRNGLFHSKGDHFIDMNQVNITYNNLLGNSIETQVNYKRYLKNLLKENIRNFIFSRPKSRRQSKVLCSNSSHVEAIDAYRNTPDDYNLIFKTASMVCEDILDKEK